MRVRIIFLIILDSQSGTMLYFASSSHTVIDNLQVFQAISNSLEKENAMI